MQNIGLPGSAVSGGAPHAQPPALRLGVLVLWAALAPCSGVLCTAALIGVPFPIPLLPLLGPLALLAVPPASSCMTDTHPLQACSIRTMIETLMILCVRARGQCVKSKTFWDWDTLR